MSYEANVLQVMIASPSDVAQERRIVTEVIHEWNAINADTKALVLMPLAWETHSAPLMGDRPQSVINRQVLEKADLLVGVFWTRIGTPTGEAASGTVEEIEKHVGAGKPAMLYFSSVPVVPESIDQDQYNKLREFREECRKKGLVEDYESFSDFRAKLTRQLGRTINTNDYLLTFISPAPETMSQTTPNVPASSIVELPDLSEEATVLLLEASQDPNGTVLKIRHMQGSVVQTNGKNFVEDNNVRSAAAWEAAVEQLFMNDLIQDQGYKGEVFSVTHSGYQIADILQKIRSEQSDTMRFEKPFYFRKGDEQPYCPTCWETKRLAVHLDGPTTGDDIWTHFECRNCGETYITDERYGTSKED